MLPPLFAPFAGKEISIESISFRGYVPTADHYEEVAQDAAENLHPRGELEDGWVIAAVSGEFEDGEMVQTDGFLAYSAATDRFYTSNEGSIRQFEEDASDADIEVVVSDA